MRDGDGAEQVLALNHDIETIVGILIWNSGIQIPIGLVYDRRAMGDFSLNLLLSRVRLPDHYVNPRLAIRTEALQRRIWRRLSRRFKSRLRRRFRRWARMLVARGHFVSVPTLFAAERSGLLDLSHPRVFPDVALLAAIAPFRPISDVAIDRARLRVAWLRF